MALSKEQIAELKGQLKEQVKNLPEEQKAEAEKQIDEMSDEAIETMLKQQQASSQKIFRMIVAGEIPSVEIDNNNKAIAVLSTKSISEGHTIIIPKSPASTEKDLSKEVHDLSKRVSEKLMSSLKAKSASVFAQTLFGETILNVIPIYDEALDLSSPATDKTKEELEKLKSKINIIKLKKEPEKIPPKEKKEPKKIIKLKRRIP